MFDAAAPIAEDEPTTERESLLEDRIRKLEAALAERASAPPVAVSEDDVADRVIAKLSALAGEPRTGSETDRVLVLASAADSQPLPPPPQGAVLHPPRTPIDPSTRRWFLTQFWAEVKLIARMYLDPHYRVSRLTQFALPAIVLLLVFNYFLFSVWLQIPVLSPLVERILVVCLGILAYKLMVRETARYREVLEYLSRYGRQ